MLNVQRYYQVEARWREVGENIGQMPWQFFREFKKFKDAVIFRDGLMNLQRNPKVIQDFEARIVEVKTIWKELPIRTTQIPFPEVYFPPCQKFASGLPSAS